MIAKIKKIFLSKYMILFIITICVFAPYISSNFVKGNDFICHLANLYAMDDNISLSDGILFPSKIRPIIFNNLGYGNGIFYPQFSYYVTIYIYIYIKQFGFSLVTAVKIFEFLLVFLSGVFMFKFVKITFKNENAGLVASIMYITAPYFCVDIFQRMAYSEVGIFLFMPMILLAITHILNKDYKKFMFYFVIGYAGMICSHLVLTVYFTMLLMVILLINIKRLLNKKTILYFILATFIVLGITSFEWVSLVEHMFKEDYWVFNEDSMYSFSKLQGRRMTLSNIISPCGKVEDIFTYTNLCVLGFVAITIFNTKKILKNKEHRFILYSIEVFTIIAFIIGSIFIDWTIMPEFLRDIQFPWRMCVFIAFGTSIIGGLGITVFRKDTKILALIIVCIVCLSNASYVINSLTFEELDSISEEDVAYNRGATGWQREYLSVNAHNSIDYLLERSQDVLVVTGDAQTEIIGNNTPYLKFSVDINDENSVALELPRLYYLGYDITFEDDNGTTEKLEYYENDNGLIEIEVNKSGTITIEYTGTTLNKIADIISVLIIILFVLFCIIIPCITKNNVKLLDKETKNKCR